MAFKGGAWKIIAGILLLLFIASGPGNASAAPRPFGSDVTDQFFIDKYFKGKVLSPVEGIWSISSQGTEADLAIIRNDTDKFPEAEYVGIVISTNSHYWGKGDIRLLLKKTANPEYFKATWLIASGLFGSDEKYASKLIMGSSTAFLSSLPGEYNWIVRTAGIKLYPTGETAKSPPPHGGSGTGFFITPRVVITNAHVVEGCAKITVAYQGRVRPASVSALDRDNDVAVLSVEEMDADVRPLFVAKSNAVAVGEKAYAYGYPVPDIQGFNAKFTEGIVSSLTGFGDHPRWFQISTPIQPGNSGGPLLDSKGRVIGITSASAIVAEFYKMTGGRLPQNVNLAVKSNYILNLMIGHPEGASLVTNEPAQTLEPSQVAAVAAKAVVFIKAEP